MDAFETVVGEILWREGYWTQTSFKVALTRRDKAAIARPTSPRWELDVIGYNGQRNVLLVVECKSYLDSTGVQFRAFNGADAKLSKRFKLFNDKSLRKVVIARLRHQLQSTGLINKKTKVKLALVCGKIVNDKDHQRLQGHFKKNSWVLWDKKWLKQKLEEMSDGGYENSTAAVVAKLLDPRRPR